MHVWRRQKTSVTRPPVRFSQSRMQFHNPPVQTRLRSKSLAAIAPTFSRQASFACQRGGIVVASCSAPGQLFGDRGCRVSILTEIGGRMPGRKSTASFLKAADSIRLRWHRKHWCCH